MKYLIVGLGNPGLEYEETRHNIGFKVVDAIAKELGDSFSLNKAAFRAEVKFKGRILVLIKPITYMNLSGKAVNYWLQAEKIPIENLMVITDDIALPFGKLRMRPKGSDAGHNGLKNIAELLKTQEFARLRFGVGNDFAKGRQIDYVLGNFPTNELNEIVPMLDKACQMAVSFCGAGIQHTMNNFND